MNRPVRIWQDLQAWNDEHDDIPFLIAIFAVFGVIVVGAVLLAVSSANHDYVDYWHRR